MDFEPAQEGTAVAVKTQTDKNEAKLKLGAANPTHGRPSTYGNYRCRCETCNRGKKAHRGDYLRELRSGEVPKEVHGTQMGYGEYACRCAKCYKYGQDLRERLANREIPDEAHGTNNGYVTYRCRCEYCKDAAREYRANRKRSKR